MCDPGLYAALQELVGKSLVSGTELKIDPSWARLLLPVEERYYDGVLTIRGRKDWLKGAIGTIGKTTDLVFVNPDIGIASKSDENNLGLAHASIKELSRIFEEGKSLIIYQHIGQGLKKGQTAANYIEQTSCRLMQELEGGRQVWAFWWHRVVSRVYFIVARTQDHKDKIKGRLEAFRKSKWMTKEHFTEVEVRKWPSY